MCWPMKNLEDILKKERHRSLAYIEIGKPFTYIYNINNEYFCGAFNKWKLYDFALDSYSYWKSNGVLHAKHESLLTTLRMMYNTYVKYKNEKS